MTTDNPTTILHADADRGGLVYPFLVDVPSWQITTHRLDDADALDAVTAAPTPTLRWVKDDKVLDLVVPGLDTAVLDTAAFLAHSGLTPSLARGAFVLSKRLARVMRPYRYWAFFDAADVTIAYDPDLDPALWDGCGCISRRLVARLADRPELSDRQRRELLSANRLELTTLHAGGQDKGHVLVGDDRRLNGADLRLPAGSAKRELALGDGRVFIGLQPVHSRDQMCLDIQSIINLHPFFGPEQLLAWAEMEGTLFLNGIRDDRLGALCDRLYATESAAEVAALARWHVGEYVASGGSLMWFAGMVKGVGRQHLKRLGSRADRLRCPAPGGRYYIFPAAVGDRAVPPGHITLDPACATAWVNDRDWLETIVGVLGGCDGDDALWVLPFTDDDGARQVLAWRSPNQPGEYVVLRPTADSHSLRWATARGPLSYPPMNSRLLPPRVDSCTYLYGSLAEADDRCQKNPAYSIDALTSTIARAAANRGTLGQYCNVLMVCRALYDRLPARLPAPLEAVIDGSVKTGLDLTPVQAWCREALQRMVTHGRRDPARAMPHALRDRLPAALRALARLADGHWLDTLAAALDGHRAQFAADLEALAAEACPPAALFAQAERRLPAGKALRQAYSRVLRQAAADADNDDGIDDAVLAAARAAGEAYLAQWPAAQHADIVLGAAAYLYAQGPQAGAAVRDGLIWQLGRPLADGGRAPGIAQLMLAGLRATGLLGEPLWTDAGPVLYYEDAPCPRRSGVPMRLAGVWFNWHNVVSGGRYRRMSAVPPAERARAKAAVATLAQTRWPGLVLTTHVTDADRVVTRTPHGNVFGTVGRDHELLALRHNRWRLAWAHAVDGNLLAVLEPA